MFVISDGFGAGVLINLISQTIETTTDAKMFFTQENYTANAVLPGPPGVKTNGFLQGNARGAGLHINIFDAPSLNSIQITISGSVFASNLGTGAALVMPAEPREATPCEIAVPYRVWAPYYSTVTISNVHFIGNTNSFGSGSAGGLYVWNGQCSIVQSFFANNTASKFGGGLFADFWSTKVTVRDCQFTNNTANRGAQLFSASGAVLTIASSLIALGVGDTQVEVERGGPVTLDHTTFECPPGFLLQNRSQPSYYADIPYSNAVFGFVCLVSTINLMCAACPPRQYTLASGSATDWNVTNPQCSDCPYGGDCAAGAANINAKPGFWGFRPSVVSTNIEFVAAPAGYACPNSQTCSYDFCNNKRTGVLCGDCLPSYSPTLGSAACRKTSDCKDAIVFWPVCALLAAIYAVWLLRPTSSRNNGATSIFFFFYQAVPYLLVGGTNDNGMRDAVLNLFNFQLSSDSGSGWACPFEMSPTTKLAMDYLPPLFIFVAVLVLHAVSIVCKCGCQCGDNKKKQRPRAESIDSDSQTKAGLARELTADLLPSVRVDIALCFDRLCSGSA